MMEPVLFRDRSRPAQIVLGGVIPAAIGALAGVLVGVSSTAYWIVAIIAGIGGVLLGFLHPGGGGGGGPRGGGGVFFGGGPLVGHAMAGAAAQGAPGGL